MPCRVYPGCAGGAVQEFAACRREKFPSQIAYTSAMGSTRDSRPARLSCDLMLDYFLDGATPREKWQVGMEL